jgi:hypothetical protein
VVQLEQHWKNRDWSLSDRSSSRDPVNEGAPSSAPE